MLKQQQWNDALKSYQWMEKNMKTNTKASVKAKRNFDSEHEQIRAAPKKNSWPEKSQDIKNKNFNQRSKQKKANPSTKRVNNKKGTNLNRRR